MTRRNGEAPHHNGTTCIKWYKCQAPECRARLNARRRGLRAGTIQPSRTLIDAEPVRQHILDLQDLGLTPSRIARLSGLSHTTICAFLRAKPSDGRGRKRDTTPETAAKILAVRPLTSTGALRRIQALIAVGWTTRKIAARSGVSAKRIIELRPADRITDAIADRIATAYEQLSQLTPEKNGVHPGHARRSRERAEANRWPDPKYWATRMDVIDDPHFEPMYGLTRGELLAADARELLAHGVPIGQAAKRLDVGLKYLQKTLSRYPEQAELAA